MPEHARSDSRALRASPILTAILLLASGQIFATARFIRGDANASGAVDISDPIATLEFLFAGTVELECQDAADSDDSGRLDITDPVHTLGFLFLSTGAIPAPGPFQCGLDPTTDEISCAVFGPCPSGPPRAPIPDGHPRATGSLTILLEGEADPGTELSITGGRFPVSTMVETSGRFAVEASLFENRLHRLRLVSTNDGGERSPPVTVEIIQDGEAPVLHVDEPLDGAEVTEAFATIAGRVSDRLSGFDGLAVTVDGEPANVAIGIGTNGTFERAGVPLVVGQNRITISARDAHGNAIDPPITIDVERIEPPFGASVIEKPAGSGDQQKAAIYQELPAPLAVRAVDGSGGPIAGAEVRFRV
ncbi:MAG TPA: hypothetical protein VK116_09965, partial [Planctomycetota bacterium]|nr:hypothetical protein [Planctomycetota bacterium]